VLERRYEVCPKCGLGFFPLDEELELLPGHLPPRPRVSRSIGSVATFWQECRDDRAGAKGQDQPFNRSALYPSGGGGL
jgi:hypothetical protein